MFTLVTKIKFKNNKEEEERWYFDLK